MNMHAHILRQMAFSRGAFGPGERRKGIIEHIRKELIEIEESDDRATEWVDVVILALDGLWRAIDAADGGKRTPEEIADDLLFCIATKQGVNERRQWPDWRTFPQDKAIEHVR